MKPAPSAALAMVTLKCAACGLFSVGALFMFASAHYSAKAAIIEANTRGLKGVADVELRMDP